nr:MULTISPECIES: hypothetical protein [unclassified Polaromonas]
MGGVIHILQGEHAGHDLVGVGIQRKMKFSPTPPGALAVFLSQPLAGTS